MSRTGTTEVHEHDGFKGKHTVDVWHKTNIFPELHEWRTETTRRRNRVAEAPVMREIAIPATGRVQPRHADGELIGHAFERAGVCSGCGGQLYARDGHWHERAALYGGAEPVCCKCKGHGA